MRFDLVVVGSFVLAPAALAQVTVGVDNSTAPWLGFMNVFNLPQDGGAYQFGSPWGVGDLVAQFDDGSNTLALKPNTIGDPDPYWYIGGGAPGNPGNKIMEANLYQQVDDTFAGQLVTFEGTILASSLTSAHQATIFIRDFAPDFSSFNEASQSASVGAFSLSLQTDPGAGRHVQWGFQVKGVNVWFTDVDPFGSMIVRTPTPAAAALLGLSGLAATRRRR